MRHVSTQIAFLPPAGEDPQADRALETGQYRDATRCAIIAGKLVPLNREKPAKDVPEVRVCRTKGVTYRRYPAGRDRKEWRQLHRDNPQPRAE